MIDTPITNITFAILIAFLLSYFLGLWDQLYWLWSLNSYHPGCRSWSCYGSNRPRIIFIYLSI